MPTDQERIDDATQHLQNGVDLQLIRGSQGPTVRAILHRLEVIEARLIALESSCVSASLLSDITTSTRDAEWADALEARVAELQTELSNLYGEQVDLTQDPGDPPGS